MIDDETINRLKAYLRNGTLPDLVRSGLWKFKQKAAEFELRGDTLWHRDTNREVVNEQKAAEIIAQRYKESTNGRDRMFDELKRQYYGISIRDINKFLQSNPVQQRFKPVPTSNPITQPTITRAPNQIWQMDTTEYVNSKKESIWMITVIDCFSKFAWVKALIKHNNKGVTARRNSFSQFLKQMEHLVFYVRTMEMSSNQASDSTLQSTQQHMVVGHSTNEGLCMSRTLRAP